MTDWRRARIVAFDTETTGLLAWDGDRVMEFGAVVIEVDDELRLKRLERHGWLINPGVMIPRDSSRVTAAGTVPVMSARAFTWCSGSCTENAATSGGCRTRRRDIRPTPSYVIWLVAAIGLTCSGSP